MIKDPWSVLKIKPTRDKQLIDNAWRKLASKYHPDHGGDEEEFKNIRSAYEAATKISKTIIEIKQPTKQFKINLQLDHSSVLDQKNYVLRWVDDQNKILECEVTVPIWNLDWGTTHSLLVKNLKTSEKHPAEIKLEMTLRSDEMVLNSEGLFWTPTLEIESVLKTRQFKKVLGNKEQLVEVDDYGKSVLKSQGYINSKGERSDIFVNPIYVWPKKNEFT